MLSAPGQTSKLRPGSQGAGDLAKGERLFKQKEVNMEPLHQPVSIANPRSYPMGPVALKDVETALGDIK